MYLEAKIDMLEITTAMPMRNFIKVDSVNNSNNKVTTTTIVEVVITVTSPMITTTHTLASIGDLPLAMAIPGVGVVEITQAC
mmetsp:Transcript_20803/g.36578  ORF Transcript_20803/g.36578 Transcript_20803/m.36578 type:complete len:82 (+) Transcript_20803:136-381(+)